ncbi:hypothetical protein PoB_002707500 [Plakobranchus ocellatus]|uniref:Uncharacterized protein n=1 Tax=Plakobranchus ocellatus TaxID=259542 RepID=A0AAV4A0Y7_9GAST|nr:hypothetical protein PoB_002707500 [Plakobranchus ocellatus]
MQAERDEKEMQFKRDEKEMQAGRYNIQNVKSFVCKPVTKLRENMRVMGGLSELLHKLLVLKTIMMAKISHTQRAGRASLT